MTRPSQFMRIELSPEQTHRLLEWAGEHLNAEIDCRLRAQRLRT